MSISTNQWIWMARWFPLVILCCLAYWIQSNLYLHKDVSIIAHTADQLLAGQTYGHDIFEPNPPIIFYLNFVPILIAKMTGMDLVFIFRITLLMLIGCTVIGVHALLRVLFNLKVTTYPVPTSRGLTAGSNDVSRSVDLVVKPREVGSIERPLQLHLKHGLIEHGNYFVFLLTYAVALILLFLPADAFGQREHLFLILTLPYMMLAACRLSEQSVPLVVAILVGLAAGIGFSIKPFFLMTLFLVELFFIVQKRNIFGWFRVESLVAILFIIGYVINVLVRYPAYIEVVLPLWMPYYQNIVESWTNILTCSLFLWCCTAILLACLVKPDDPHFYLKRIILLGLFGSIFAYLIPRVTWYYHILPALSWACLWFVLMIGELIASDRNRLNVGVSCLLMSVVFFIPISQSSLRTIQSIAYFHSDNPERKLMNLFNQYSIKPNYLFFSMTHDLYHLELYSTAKQVGSFSSCYWEYARLGHGTTSYQQTLLSQALQIMTHDLNVKKPQFVIVDIPSSQIYLKQRIDYPKTYSRDLNFREAWSHYKYLTQIEAYDVYQRIPTRSHALIN